MRNKFLLPGLALTLVATVAVRADDTLPQPVAPKHFEKLAAHSPFAPPTAPVTAAPVATPPPGPSWSDNLAVTSLMQNGNVYTATILEKDSSEHYIVRSDAPDEAHQLAIASVKWADKPDAVRVTLRKGTQFGDVQFDASALPDSSGSSTPATPAPAPVPAARPNMVTQPGMIRPPPGLPPPPQRFPQTNQGSAANLLRNRPPIRANPGAPMRPVITPQNAPRAAPVRPVKNNDDDDDE